MMRKRFTKTTGWASVSAALAAAVFPSSATDERKYPWCFAFLPVVFGDGVIAQPRTVVDISCEGGRFDASTPHLKRSISRLRSKSTIQGSGQKASQYEWDHCSSVFRLGMARHDE